MKTLFALLSVISTLTFLSSCDKVENPIKPAITLDTTFFPGNWEDYVKPTFTANTNTLRNVLLEDYTGHRCPNCPAAGYIAKAIHQANPTRVYVASIHAAPGGIGNFQKPAFNCGTAANPNNEFCTVLYNNESIAYGTAFNGGGFGFFGNPQGNINRATFSGSTMFQFSTEWASRCTEVITENDLKVNIQAKSNYYTETNGLYLHTEVEFLTDLTGGSYNTVVYLIENEVEDFQDSSGVIVENYKHHDVFRGCIDALPWGRPIVLAPTTGSKSYYDYSFGLPAGKINTDYHLLIYVYDVATYEILQVIKHEF